MTHRLSVAHLSAITMAPHDFIHAAADAGFSGVGLRLLQVTEDSPGYPLHHAAALRATQAALQSTGLAVRDIEFVKLTPQIDIAALAPMLDTGALLGARHVIAAPYDPDLSRLAERLAALSALAGQRGIGVVLEFFPWTVLPDLAACWALVQQAGPEIGILVDSLHFDRSGADHDLLASIPPARLPFAHLCDARRQPSYTTDALLHTARAERLPPGAGDLDLPRFIGALPRGIDMSLEVPMTEMLQRRGGPAVLRRLYEATQALLAGLP